MWGELAAWAISADLAERIDDVEAKMAATSQAHDEARHFYVLRDYLRALGEPVPRLGGIGRRLLIGILETDSLVHKLIGMQLLVESNALAIFRGLVEAKVEPVLAELLALLREGRGAPRRPRRDVPAAPVEDARPPRDVGVAAFQLRCVGLLMSGGMVMRDDFRALGIDPRAGIYTERTLSHQRESSARCWPASAATKTAPRGSSTRRASSGQPSWSSSSPRTATTPRAACQRAALGAWERIARRADHALA